MGPGSDHMNSTNVSYSLADDLSEPWTISPLMSNILDQTLMHILENMQNMQNEQIMQIWKWYENMHSMESM